MTLDETVIWAKGILRARARRNITKVIPMYEQNNAALGLFDEAHTQYIRGVIESERDICNVAELEVDRISGLTDSVDDRIEAIRSVVSQSN